MQPIPSSEETAITKGKFTYVKNVKSLAYVNSFYYLCNVKRK